MSHNAPNWLFELSTYLDRGHSQLSNETKIVEIGHNLMKLWLKMYLEFRVFIYKIFQSKFQLNLLNILASNVLSNQMALFFHWLILGIAQKMINKSTFLDYISKSGLTGPKYGYKGISFCNKIFFNNFSHFYHWWPNTRKWAVRLPTHFVVMGHVYRLG